MTKYKKVAVFSDSKPEALAFKNDLLKAHNYLDAESEGCTLDNLDVMIVLGGDGFMLHAMHKFLHLDCMFYGVNYGTVGFLMNPKKIAKSLEQSLCDAEIQKLATLGVKIESRSGQEDVIAINEASFLRQKSQAAWIRIYVNDVVRLETLVADGVLVSTPAGSTAYNFSVYGSIVPLSSNLFSMMPISPFRPRYWRGALLLDDSVIQLDMLDTQKRPVSATVDFRLFEDISRATICKSNKTIKLLFDKDLAATERVIREQFSF